MNTVNRSTMTIEEQWQWWQDNNQRIDDVNTDELRQRIIDDLSFVSAMNVKEYTLYQKWCDVQEKYPTVETNPFFSDRPAMRRPEQAVLLNEVKNNFWLPDDPEEYIHLQPELIWTDGADIQSHL